MLQALGTLTVFNKRFLNLIRVGCSIVERCLNLIWTQVQMSGDAGNHPHSGARP